jgi:hypothetical protein
LSTAHDDTKATTPNCSPSPIKVRQAVDYHGGLNLKSNYSSFVVNTLSGDWDKLGLAAFAAFLGKPRLSW